MRAGRFLVHRCRKRPRRRRSIWSRLREESRRKYLLLADECAKSFAAIAPETRPSALPPVLLDSMELLKLGFRLRKGKEPGSLLRALAAGTVGPKNKRMKVATSIASELSKVVAFENI